MKNQCVILFTFFSLIFYAQKFTLAGEVQSDRNISIEYAYIEISTNNQVIAEAYTDAKGKFEIANIASGIYNIQISFSSFDTYQLLQYELNKNENLGIISLKSTPVVENSTVVVTATKKIVDYKLDKKVYNVSEDKSLLGGNSLDALNNAPSVSVDVDGTVSMRGNSNVKILIDGKPSSSSDTNSLKSIPTDAIERIEVVTVPSAKYDAEGSTGIINIVLKKGKKKGVNGSISTSIGYPDLASIALNINKRTDKFNTFMTLGSNYSNSPGNGSVYSIYYNNLSSNAISNATRDMERQRKGWILTIGSDWFIDDKNTLGFTSKINPNQQNNTTTLNYQDYFEDVPTTIAFSQRNENAENPEKNYAVGMNFSHDFNKKGEKFTLDSQWSKNTSETDSRINQFNADNSTSFQRYTTDEKTDNLMLQVDYVLPIQEESQFETGAKTEYLQFNNDYKAYDFDITTNNYIPIDFYNNNFVYEQWIHAAYAQYGGTVNKFTYLTGLRVEKTDVILKNVEIENVFYNSFKKNYTEFFPTLHLGYNFTKKNQIQIGYSRRIERPRDRMLNPFFTLSDNRNVFSGNPNIDPTFTHVIELGYTFSTNQFTIAPNLFYNYSTNPLQLYTEAVIINNTDVIRSFPINLATEKRLGVEINANYKPIKFLILNAELSYFKGKVLGSYLGDDLSTDYTNNFRGKITSITKLPKDISLQVRGVFNGKRIGAQTTTNARYALDTSLSKDLFNKKASMSFAVQDLFNSNKRGRNSSTDTFYSDAEIQFKERQFVLNFSYMFGKNIDKKEKHKKNINEGGNTGNDIGM